ncbi:peptide/nickel transport system substrate-binding protein [Humitalea rosea]|uniref:Peptide/nickel transport system substrate-binding protein n=1 Tax=Humitalea rosea TaxID=990373 RepID=A0A2W7J8S4_9PROT|nr:ABC transporter substrate-binding protein [Humitalea rosea]PZW48266.1 peptide/nickel transport system substrate-binding protein [Humitalea rosea]
MPSRHSVTMLLAGLFGACLAGAAGSRDLTVGLAAPPTSFDPHFHAHAPSIALQRHVYEGLVTRGADLVLRPTLARDWVALPAADGWEFHMDPEARFQDGAPVTAADAAASLSRAATIPNSPGRWTPFITEIATIEVVDALTLRLRTHGPAPLLPGNLPTILIIPETVARGAATADFNAGTAAIGSGPYRLQSYAPGGGVTLVRADDWWQRRRHPEQPAEPWTRVVFQILPNDASRTAALLAGDADLIEAVPTRDVARLEAAPGISIARRASVRFIYIALDLGRDVSPGVADAAGRPMARNPLKDVRVRRALSVGINRPGLVAQVMDGQGVPTGQFLARDLPSADPALAPDPYDPALARRLLAEAGWGGGFTLTLAGPNDRLVNDDRILQAVAQMWERIGVRTMVEAMPSAVYFRRFAGAGFSAGLSGWGTSSGEPNTHFTSLLATRDAARGRGSMNPTGYGNPQVDALVDQALMTIEDAPRQRLWRQATQLALAEDVALLPLHHQVNIWAMRGGLSYQPRADELTDIMGLRPIP